jgi:DinB superfamily
MNEELIEQYAQGGEKLRLAIRGLTDEDLKSFPVPGTWSIQQIVIHVMDSELISADRMKRIIAEDNPTLIGYDETKFSKKLYYHDQPAADAISIIELNRRMFALVLRRLPDEAFNRTGMHSERGKIALGQYLQAVVNHLEHHLKFVYEKREKLGKLMW